MVSKFTSPIYEVLTVLFLVGYLFRSLSLLIHLGDILAIIPSTIELAVFVFLFLKSQHLPYSMKLWAIYLIVTGGISFVSKLMIAIPRDTYPEGIEWKALIILSGILILWIATRRIILEKKDVVDNF